MKTTVLVLCAALASSGCATLSSGDSDISNAVTARIAEEPRIGLAQLTVREENGVVSIGGFLSSLEQMRLLDEVIDDVQTFEGVTSVENNVTTTSPS